MKRSKVPGVFAFRVLVLQVQPLPRLCSPLHQQHVCSLLTTINIHPLFKRLYFPFRLIFPFGANPDGFWARLASRCAEASELSLGLNPLLFIVAKFAVRCNLQNVPGHVANVTQSRLHGPPALYSIYIYMYYNCEIINYLCRVRAFSIDEACERIIRVDILRS